MISHLNLAMSQTNDAYRDSGIYAELKPAHYTLVQYTEAFFKPFKSALREIRDATDGMIDNVHDLRKQYGADIVVMIIDDDSDKKVECGVAPLEETSVDNMFSVVNWYCAAKAGVYTFGHGESKGIDLLL